ncbi:UDP-glucose/GDP-mannose dehydrogenase family protein [Wandonia haliotis]|uniref:UDP-glucose 6-dehydrogenase n=1 Tax=Wandonia haliotis TaxID=574963 RepID=A0ABP3Y5P1_9FLAO
MEKLAVIGIGRLGLCFALNAEKSGYEVIGIDVNQEYVNQLNAKTYSSPEPLVNEYLSASCNFSSYTDIKVIEQEQVNIIYIIVPTPSQHDNSFSHSYIESVVSQLMELKKPEELKHIIIGATVMPGYCNELSVKMKDWNYSISYNPEFIAQGSIMRDQQNPDQILIGEGHPDATIFLKNLYARMCISSPEYHVMDTLSAEITKLATNCFLTMKISFANSIGDLIKRTGGDEDKVLSAIGADSRIGSKYLGYGYGFGGPCFPRDNQALLYFAKEQKMTLPLSEATIEVNKNHLQFQYEQLLRENREEFVFDYVTYKKNTDIIEQSQQLELAVKLANTGKKVILKNSNHIKHSIELMYPGLFYYE